MKAHQAVFGPSPHGHVLISCSGLDGLFDELTFYTDLPGQAPLGCEWAPFTRGFPFQGHYVFSCTVDAGDVARSGSVRSYVLALPLDVVEVLTGLEGLFVQLGLASNSSTMDLDPVELESVTPMASESPDRRVTALASALASDPRTAVWVGQDGFEEAIAFIWSNLWGGARRTLKFGFAFGPPDISGLGFTCVSIPADQSARWSANPLVGLDVTDVPMSAGVALLTGRDGSGGLRELVTVLDDVGLQKLPQLTFVQESLSSDDPRKLRGALLALQALAPKKTEATEAKRTLLKRIKATEARWTAEDVIGLNNANPQAFPNGKRILDGLVMAWIEGARHAPLELVKLVRRTIAGASTWWSGSVEGGIAALWAQSPAEASRLFWTSVDDDLNAAVWLLETVFVNGADLELALAAPKELDVTNADQLSELAVARGCWCMHIAIQVASRPPDEAVAAHLLLDPDPTAETISFLSSLLGPDLFIAATLANPLPPFLIEAAKVTVETPRLMRKLDPRDFAWRGIWLHRIRLGCEALDGIDDAQPMLGCLVDGLFSGDNDVSELLTELVEGAEQVDLRAYPRRQEAWDVLPSRLRSVLLERTARSILEEHRTDFGKIPDLEPPLEDALKNSGAVTDVLRNLQGTNQWENALDLVERIKLNQRRFLTLLTHLPPPTVVETVIRIGLLIERAGWQKVAKKLISRLCDGENEWEPVLPFIADFVSVWEWVELKLKGYSFESSFDLWSALEGVAVRLYPEGPDHVWERAGGDIVDLQAKGSNRERWQSLLSALRRRRFRVSASDLLSEMSNDFSDPQLETLRKLQRLS